MNKPPVPIRIAVIGYGFGRFHVKTLIGLSGVRLVAVADRRASDLEDAAKQYGFKPYRDAAAMLDHEKLDAVIIAVPPQHRGAIIEQAVKNQLAMFVEKPWASNRAHARELSELCKPSSKPVMVGFSFRYHPTIVKLKELVHLDLGKPRMLSGQYVFGCSPPIDGWIWNPDSGNGFINENSCHLFDAVCYLMGPPVRISAEAECFTDCPMEDAATITLKFESGAIAALTCGAIGVPSAIDYPRIELFAEHGQAQLVGQHHIWRSLNWQKQGDVTIQRYTAPPEQLGATRYTHALEHFIECVYKNQSPSATVEDGVLSVDIAMAVIDSARNGCAIDL